MSEVRLIIRDARRSICGNIHGSVADRLVAALSAEPETIEELEAAVARFQRPRGGRLLTFFRNGDDDTPYDAGIVVIDLAARLVAYESSYSSPSAEGCVEFHDGTSATDVGLRYHLPDDWLFVSYVEGWQSRAEERRRSRSANPPIDTRAILYGRPLVEFVARECWVAFSALPARSMKVEAAPSSPATAARPELAAPKDDGAPAVVHDVHARWLMAQRDDLGGRTPRDVMHEKRGFISWDMQSRCDQWSRLDEAPPGLDTQSHAYRFAGYGTHEMVMYYDLVRHLLWECRELCREFRASAKSEAITVGDFLTTAVPRLEQIREDWLDAPNPEFHGRTPRSIIERERRRLPEVVSKHEMIIDHDCPLCQMAADMPGPTFWHLDGCNMDDDFAFSIFHDTREEYDKEQRDYEEFNRKYAKREAERERLGVKYPRSGYSDPDYVWERSFVAPESEDTSLLMRLFSVGFNLSELICDLKEPAEHRALVDALSRDFGNLRDVIQNEDASLAAALVEPLLARFCDSLEAAATEREDLRPKCDDLQVRLRRFLEPPQERDDSSSPDWDDDVPF